MTFYSYYQYFKLTSIVIKHTPREAAISPLSLSSSWSAATLISPL